MGGGWGANVWQSMKNVPTSIQPLRMKTTDGNPRKKHMAGLH